MVVQEGTTLPVIWDDGRWFQVTLSPGLGTDEELGFIHGSTVAVERRDSALESAGGDEPGDPAPSVPAPDSADTVEKADSTG